MTIEVFAGAGFALQLVVYIVTIMMVFNRQKNQNDRIESELKRFTNALKELEDDHDKLRDEVHKEYITDDKYREDLHRLWNRLEKIDASVTAMNITLAKELRSFAETITAELINMRSIK
ncbi:hypothetical protein HQ531_03505 [bacterium]|nr:hypothetical protein [bacterium]